MDKSAMVSDYIDAGADFVLRLNDYKPVRAACWLRREEFEERYLYVALEGLSPENRRYAKQEVRRIAEDMTDFIDPFRVRVIGTDHEIALAVTELYRRHPVNTPREFHERALAGAAEMFIYPPVNGNS